MDLVGVASPEPGSAAPWGPSKCPWGTPQNTVSCSLADVMSEQLAKELQLEEAAAAFPEAAVAEGPFITGENMDTSSDLMLAQMLQMEFDREYDAQLRREEKKFNGDSKVSISFENYRKVHPYEDSDSSEEEVDWQDTCDDPYIPAKPVPTPKKGFIGKGKDITTKHDEVVCGRKNTARMENFAPGFQVGDGIGMDLKLSNHVFNALKQHAYSEERRSARLHEKKEHSTAEKAVDPKTRLLMYKMVNSGMLETITGCISTGKESVVFHAYGGRKKSHCSHSPVFCPQTILWQPLVPFVSLWFCLFLTFHIHPVTKCECIMSGFSNSASCFYYSLYHISELHSFLWMNNVPFYGCATVCLSSC
ncbi:serine/threonine-protein kinase RIO3-like isoform X1 [Manis javanica]|uniref:serine/threonine-protein kinase RIO3-like isoform X1 n=2 Tax=Manis javanica TaxID=9974 RepID=UPI003C6CF80E